MKTSDTVFLATLVAIVAAAIALVPTAERGAGHRDVADVDWTVVRDDPNERLTISWMGPPVHPTAEEGSWIERHLEEVFNVELKPVFQDWNAYSKRRALMLAGGDVPDVNWDGDPLILRRNLHHGFVLEVPYDVILRYAPTYVRQLNQYGPEAWLYAAYRGKNYGIGTYAANNIYPPAAVWRMDWLRKVGVTKVPETLEEMHDALHKFRHNDPDGNGILDTYGFCPVIHWSLTFLEVFNAFGVLPQDFQMCEGRVVWGGVLPAAKEALALLRQWYDEGLIDPDFAIGTIGTPQTYTKLQNGKTGYCFQNGNWSSLDLTKPNSFYSQMRELNPAAELAPGKPLIGRDGVRRKRFWGGSGHVIWFGRPVAQKPEVVIRVLKMFEAFAKDQDLFVASRIGKRGVHWEWSAQRGLYPLPPYDKRGEDSRNLLGFGPFENCYGFYSCSSAPLAFTNKYLPEGNLAFREAYRNPRWGFKNVLGKSDVVDSAGLYLEDLRQFQMTAFVEIIRGDRPLDYFDEFVRLWHARGGEMLTREANAMLRDMREIYGKVGAEYRPGGFSPVEQ